MPIHGQGIVPRIALTMQGDPTDAATWSGVPASLASGLEAAGCAVAPVRAEFPGAGRVARLLGMDWAEQATSRAFAAACGAAGDRRLVRAGELDGVVMLGSGYALSTAVPTVSFDDMTVALARRQGAPPYDGLDEAGARRWQARQRRIYERARGCCATSTWAADSIREDYGIPASKVHVVGVGHNVDPGRAERDWSAPRFLFVGADWERKRGDAVVAAFAAVRRRHPEATLDLVGGHPEVDAEGVAGHGRLPLNSEDGRRRYGELLRRATCFLMPSTYEPFGIAYVDAASSGIASVGTTVGGAADAIGDGGRLVDPADEGALREAMLELSNPETARRLGERAYERSKLLTWRAVAERLLRALRPAGLDLDRLAPYLEPQPRTPRAA
jgi:Glycosyl transferases group 1